MSRRAGLGFVVLWAALAGCGSPAPATYVWVDVQARPAVRGVTTLEVTVSDGGDRLVRTFGDGAAALALPTAFTVTPNAHRGPLTIAGTAFAADGLVVAAATATVAIVAGGRAETTVLLEPTDFQVNTTVAGSQIITDYHGGRGGRQLAASADGSFAVVFENIGDLGRYDGLGRLFAPDGAPRQNATSLSVNDFVLNTSGTESVFFVAAAAAPDGGFLATWVDQALSTVNARRFDADGKGGAELHVADLTVPGAAFAGAGHAAALRDGGFVVVFTQQRSNSDTSLDLRARLLDATGAPRLNHTGTTLDFPLGAATTHSRERPAVAVGADGAFLVGWLDLNPATGDAAIVVQRFDLAGQAQGGEIIIQPLGTPYPEAPNLAATPDGYFVVFADDPPAAGETDVFVRFVATNGVAGVPAYRVTTSTTGDQTDPAVAAAADGRALVVWADRQSRAEDSEPASIRGRLLQPLGLPLGVDFAVNTTTTRAQVLPSVAVAGHDAFVVSWEDDSALGPDTDGSGIRARFLYPDFAPADGRLGAGCATSACQASLVCLARAAGSFCHQGCPSAQVGAACASGGMCADVSGAPSPACLFR